MSELRGLSTELADLCTSLRGLDGIVVGAAPLFDELLEFAEQWSSAADELSEHATRAADYVQGVLLTFQEADFTMAEQLLNRELG